jgi:hypothetical protein
VGFAEESVGFAEESVGFAEESVGQASRLPEESVTSQSGRI